MPRDRQTIGCPARLLAPLCSARLLMNSGHQCGCDKAADGSPWHRNPGALWMFTAAVTAQPLGRTRGDTSRWAVNTEQGQAWKLWLHVPPPLAKSRTRWAAAALPIHNPALPFSSFPSPTGCARASAGLNWTGVNHWESPDASAGFRGWGICSASFPLSPSWRALLPPG